MLNSLVLLHAVDGLVDEADDHVLAGVEVVGHDDEGQHGVELRLLLLQLLHAEQVVLELLRERERWVGREREAIALFPKK